MADLPQPGGQQRSQQKFVVFEEFVKMNTQAARQGLSEKELAWQENLQPIAPNNLITVPATAAAALAQIGENISIMFYAVMGGVDYFVAFSTAGSAYLINIATGIINNFAPDGTFTSAPDVTTWQAERILINDLSAGYSTFDGTNFIQSGSISPNIVVTNGGSNYAQNPPINIFVGPPPPISVGDTKGGPFTGGIAATVVNAGSWTTSPSAGNATLTISPSSAPAGGILASAVAIISGPPFSAADVLVTNPGAGYLSAPNFTLSVTGAPAIAPQFTEVVAADGATASAIVVGGAIVGVAVTNPGGGFGPNDVVVMSAVGANGSGSKIAAHMSGSGISSISITNQGVFSTPTGFPSLTISAPNLSGGVQATATCTINAYGGGSPFFYVAPNSVVITNHGSGYTSAPSVTLTHSGGTVPPAFTANMQRQHVTSLTATSAGTGYPPSQVVDLIFTPTSGAIGNVSITVGGTVTTPGLTVVSGGSYTLGSTPTVVVAAGSGAVISAHVWPYVPPGTTLAIFQGRVWLGGGTLLQWTGTGQGVLYGGAGYDDFSAIDASGSLEITDADLVHAITALRSFNNYLYVMGDQSVKQIGNISIDPASQATLFTILTLSSDQGTIYPKSCISYDRIFLFANNNGIFGVFGSTVQKISGDLDGIFKLVDFSLIQPQGAIVDLNSIHTATFLVRYMDPLAGERSILLMFDGKRWYVTSQSNTLSAIQNAASLASDENILYGAVTSGGTDVTQLFAQPNVAVSFKIQTAMTHHGNAVQGKRVVRAGFTASSTSGGTVSMSIDTDSDNGSDNLMVLNGGFALVGGANDSHDEPIAGAGVYLGMTITGVMSGLTMHNLACEYQEGSLWKG